jgi:hypothetical protein
MKINKLDRFETKTESDISPEQDKQNREIIVNLLTPIVEKVQNLPVVLVASSFADLMNELKTGVKRQPVIVQSSENPVFKSAVPTKNISETVKETFSEDEKLILESLK